MSVETTTVPGVAQAPAAEDKRGPGLGWLLAVCCVAQFMVILDLSIVNVALPSIQSSLGFTSPELQWVVDAYAITFAGFLMLGGRAADHYGQRRTFVIALVLFAVTSLIGGAAPSQGWLIGGRAIQGIAGALMAACSLAIITASFPAWPEAAPGDRHLGDDERAGRSLRRAVRRDHRRSAELALGAADQPADRDRGGDRGLRGRHRARAQPRADIRPGRRADADDRPDHPRLRRRRSGAEGLEHVRRARSDRPRHRAARRVRPDRGALRVEPADPVQGADQDAARREQHRAAVQRGAVPDVGAQLALSAAGARALAAAHRADLPADDARADARRPARRQTREPVRRAPGARRRADDADRRAAAAELHRLQRQRHRLRHDPRPARGGRDRDVDRAVDDRRDDQGARRVRRGSPPASSTPRARSAAGSVWPC